VLEGAAPTEELLGPLERRPYVAEPAPVAGVALEEMNGGDVCQAGYQIVVFPVVRLAIDVDHDDAPIRGDAANEAPELAKIAVGRDDVSELRLLRDHVVEHATPTNRLSPAVDAGGVLGPRARRWTLLTIACLVAAGLFVRVDAITQPSLATRELHDALLARHYELRDGNGLPVWKQRVLQELPKSVKPVEPPVLDFAAASLFRLTHGERLWIPRMFSVLAWLIGGAFLLLIALRVTTRSGALVALGLYLLWPYGVFISRLYMPDATMVALLLAGALAVIRYWEQPSLGRLLAAGALTSFATVVKPGVAAIFLVSLFLALAVARRAFVLTLVRGRIALFVALSLALSVGYYVYGTYVDDFLVGSTEGRVDVHWLTTAWFWKGWREMLSIVLPFPQTQKALVIVPLLLGLAGVVLGRRGTPKAILIGLGVGYVAYAFTFSSYTASHAYYVLPLLPILALAIGAFSGAMLERVEGSKLRPVAVAFLVLSAGVAIYKSHATFSGPYDRQAFVDYQAFGRITGHTNRAMIVDERLKSPAMYWGWIVG
jgi:hypothetical protein